VWLGLDLLGLIFGLAWSLAWLFLPLLGYSPCTNIPVGKIKLHQNIFGICVLKHSGAGSARGKSISKKTLFVIISAKK
jgi:hypothetical protein